MTFGLTPQGFVAKRLVNIKTDMENAMIAEFGDINTDPQTVFGQFIGVLSKTVADVWDNLEAIYNSQYPATAEGTSLDNVVQLNGIQRIPAQQTRVQALVNGIEGTMIPQGSLARIAQSGEIFYSATSAIITRGNALYVKAKVLLIQEQAYSILLGGVLFTYSKPTITFTGNFVTGNNITVTINGTVLTSVPYNTSNNQTLADISNVILGSPYVLTSVAVNPSTINITPVDGINVVVNSVQITGGVSQPTYAVTFRVPQAVLSFLSDFVAENSIVITLNGSTLPAVPYNTSQAQTATDIQTMLELQAAVDNVEILNTNRVFRIDPTAGQPFVINSVSVTGGASQPAFTIENPVFDKLAQIINVGDVDVTALDNSDGTMTVTSDTPFSASAGAEISIIDQSSPLLFLSQNYGPIPAPANTLTEILTPISGWNSINNVEAGLIGRFIETDSELRIRRRNSIRLLGAATVEAIRARLLQQVPGVTSALVFENRTLLQEPIQIVFSQDLVASNIIDININGVDLASVNFTTNHLTTMQLIADEIESQTNLVATAVVGGTANRTITMTMQFAVQVLISVVVSSGASQANVTYNGGRPPKSFECVVQGGSDLDVGNKIWQVKPAGIQTFGNTEQIIIDSQNQEQAINFSRPVPVYIWVVCELTLYEEETFPINGNQLVAEAILVYGNSIGIGTDVLIQRVLSQIFNVSGIASGDMQIAATNSPNDGPVYGIDDISINDNQISTWDLSRINITLAI